MGKYNIFYLFENPRRGMQARNFTTNVPKILDLKSSSEQIFPRKLSLGAPELWGIAENLLQQAVTHSFQPSTGSHRDGKVISDKQLIRKLTKIRYQKIKWWNGRNNLKNVYIFIWWIQLCSTSRRIYYLKFVTEVVFSTNSKLETSFSCCELSFRVQNVGSLPGSQSASTRSPIVSGRRFVWAPNM